MKLKNTLALSLAAVMAAGLTACGCRRRHRFRRLPCCGFHRSREHRGRR